MARSARANKLVRATSQEDIQKEMRAQQDKFLVTARERFKLASDAVQRERAASLDDYKFSVGEQWPSDVTTQRNIDKRPCLTMNRMPGFIRQVTNEQRQQRPAVQVNPTGGKATKEVARVLQGMMRHIDIISDSEIAYDTAFDSMVRGGEGFWRILTEYIDDESFDQEIKIARILNPFSVYFDPTCVEPAYADADFCFVIEDMPTTEYKIKHPGSELATLEDFRSIGDAVPDWATKDTIRVAEYFYVEYTRKTIWKMQNGEVIDREQAEEGEQPVAFREVVSRKVHWAKINAREVMEERVWPGLWIPIIAVTGDDLIIDGKRHLSGLVRNAKDPQRMYNYWVSAATETIALAPRSPFVVAEGQLEGHEVEWQQANVRNWSYLTYKSKDIAGQLIPPPQRNAVEPPIQAMSVMLKQADNDLKATTGIYDASLGIRGPEESGKAVMLRQKQTDISTFNFNDNMARSMRHSGRVILNLMPVIYDAPRIQRVINPDESVRHVAVYNSQTTKMGNDEVRQTIDDAIAEIHDIGVGRYDVTVSIGPSFQTKRQEAAQSILSVVQAFPQILQYAGDILLANMDWNGAEELAARFKKMLPPQLQEEDDGSDPKKTVERLQAALNMMGEQQKTLIAELDKSSEIIKTKRLELESRERVAGMNAQVTLLQTEAKIRGEAGMSVLQQMMDTIKARLELLHDHMTLEKEASLEPQPMAPTGGVEPGQNS